MVVACYVTIGFGTAFGGWRIVKTMGQRITKLKPVGGFCAETGGAAMLFIATALGIPVSTTHTITGAIVGVGTAQNVSAVRWGIAGDHRLGLGADHPLLGLHRRARLVARPGGCSLASAARAWLRAPSACTSSSTFTSPAFSKRSVSGKLLALLQRRA